MATLLLSALAVSPLALPARAAPWQAKVDPAVLQAATSGPAEFLIFLNQQADLSPASHLSTKQEKGRFVVQALQRTAAQSQAPLLAMLQARGVEARAYWVANVVWARADLDTIQAVASRPEVAYVYANPAVALDLPEPSLAPTGPDQLVATEGIEWNVHKINADDVWAAGYTGQGVIVGGQDTGYRWTHSALKAHYRGWNGFEADHDFNWHDAIHSGGGICGADSPAPCDDYWHGTHTMGTIVGDDGSGNQIGVAPGARWIGCRNMAEGNGTPATYIECYQWFMAPTDISGTISDTLLTPDVINNSWACPPTEGCGPLTLQTVVENVRAAGILTVQSAGNSGPSCSTISDPAAIYDASFTVGATQSSDLIASFSSRGPVIADGSLRLKPDISAPGVSIRSAVNSSDTSYFTANGTSMAAPHVAGLAALLISADPELAGQVDLLEAIITHSALLPNPPYNCGGDIPNNTYGWGRIDAWAAYQLLPRLQLDSAVSHTLASPGEVITYTLTVTNSHPFTAQPGVVISDTLPLSTTLVSASQPYSLTGPSLSWSLGELAPGEARSVQFSVQIDPAAVGDIIQPAAWTDASLAVPVPGPQLITQLLPPATWHVYYFPFAAR